MIRLENVSFSYPGKQKDAFVFSNLNLNVKKGEWIALTGEGGSGKTTLLKLIKGILDPVSGKILVAGRIKDKNMLMPEVAYLGSNPENQIIGTVVEDEMLFSLQFLSFDPSKVRSQVEFLLDKLELLSLRYYFTSKLSGGEQQKLLLASHLAQQPSVILVDNAFSMLDSESKKKCLQLLKMYQSSTDTTVIMVDSRSDVISWADRVVHLYNGIITLIGTSSYSCRHR